MRALLCLPLLIALPGATTLADERRALSGAQRDAAAAGSRARQLAQRAAGALNAAQRTQAEAAAVAARIEAAEAGLEAAEARVRIVAALQRAQRTTLAAEQGSVVRLTGALQTMARRPLALTLAQPGSTEELVRVRALLAGVMPAVQSRTAGLRAELARTRRLRAAADGASGQLRASRAALDGERLALARIEAAQRARARRFARGALFESDRATALGEDARDIAQLMGQLEAQAALRERLASLPGPVLRPGTGGRSTAIAASGAPGGRNPPYRLPVRGEIVTGMGERGDSGARSRGVTIATAPSAIVVAPTAGRVAFAAPYRGFGRIVILDHGEGWTTLITGLAGLNVEVGEEVAQGSPLGRAADRRPQVTVELRRNGTPVDIARRAG